MLKENKEKDSPTRNQLGVQGKYIYFCFSATHIYPHNYKIYGNVYEFIDGRI